MSAAVNIELSPEDADILREILNIGAGRAAKVLGELMNDTEIELSLPNVEVDTIENLDKKYSHLGLSNVVSIAFSGSFVGSASLLFSEESGQLFSHEIAGDLVSADEMIAMKEGILKEVGNIVINGVMGTIASLIDQSLDYDLPIYKENISEFAAHHTTQPSPEDIVITANISFNIQAPKSEGQLFIIFTKNTYQIFLNSVRHYFEVD